MGQGQSTQSVQGLSDVASMSGQKAYNDARISISNSQDNAQLGGAVIGAGTRYGLQQTSDDGGI